VVSEIAEILTTEQQRRFVELRAAGVSDAPGDTAPGRRSDRGEPALSNPVREIEESGLRPS